MSTWIKQPAAVFHPAAADGQLACDGIVVRDNRIAEILAPGQTPSQPVEDVVDAQGMVLLPGLINTHHHFYQTLTRCLRQALNKPLFPWLTSLYPVWANLTEEMIACSTELAMTELLLSGCTTTTDHHYIFSDALTHAIDQQVNVAVQMGMRVVLTRGSMSLGESAGGLPPDKVVQDEAQILADSERLVRHYHDAGTFSMCQIALAPCSPFSVTPDLMRATAELAEHHELLLHTHLAETEDENQFCEQHFGTRPVGLMAQVGWLSPRSWFAHGIHFTAEEIAQLGERGCGVTHCPSSNMMLASGSCRVAELESAGVRVGLGVDGSASNDHSNLMQEVRQAFLLQRLRTPDASVSHIDALRWATLGGAQVLNRAELGRIEIGAAADVALFDLRALRFSGAQDPLAALVLCGAHRAAYVMINGRWRVREHQLVEGDEAELRKRHMTLARQLGSA